MSQGNHYELVCNEIGMALKWNHLKIDGGYLAIIIAYMHQELQLHTGRAPQGLSCPFCPTTLLKKTPYSMISCTRHAESSSSQYVASFM